MYSLVISIFVFSLYFLLLPQINALNWTYLLQVYYTSYSLWLNRFLNSLLQYASFFKIRQIYSIKKAVGGLLAFFLRILKKLAYCMRELRKWLSCNLYEVKSTCSKYVELNTMFNGNSRKYKGKNKNGYFKAPIDGYLSEIRFWALENMS